MYPIPPNLDNDNTLNRKYPHRDPLMSVLIDSYSEDFLGIVVPFFKPSHL